MAQVKACVKIESVECEGVRRGFVHIPILTCYICSAHH